MNEKQKRFLLVFVPLAVVVVVVWGALTNGASDDSGAPSLPEKKVPVESEPEEEGEPASITEADREATKDLALAFMRDYLMGTPMEKMRGQMTPDTFAELAVNQEERPTVELQKLEATRVENYLLEQQGKLCWTVWVTVPRGKKGTFEVAYDVTLNRVEGSWRVEGVSEVDYPEHGG